MTTYNDITAVMQVIGIIFNNQNILEQQEKYHFNEADFTEDLHKVLFGAIYNLHELGTEKITKSTIEDYLENRPKKYGIYQLNRGSDWLDKIEELIQPAAFDYYYGRMKKMTLLRMYQGLGIELKDYYDMDNLLDTKKKQEQEEWLDNATLESICEIVDKEITNIRLKYVDNTEDDFIPAGEGIMDVLERLRTTPEIGYPLFGPLINGVCRGARLKKFYLRSAATGVGKTRAMIADACYIGCNMMYDLKTHSWVSTGAAQPTLYVTTEQDEEEIQTMMVAFLSAVDEDHIVTGQYEPGEWARIESAANILDNSKIIIKKLPDFSLTDIENAIKYAVHEYDCHYVFYDYIHSSMKILSEVTGKAGVKGLREDNVLFMISVRLKDLCNQYGIFIMSSTQLNADYTTATQYDQNLLRGAKSIADKIDFGAIMLQTTKEDEEALAQVLAKEGVNLPEIKISVYKNRRGRYKDILLWCRARRDICRIEPVFATNYNYEIVPIKDLEISVND